MTKLPPLLRFVSFPLTLCRARALLVAALLAGAQPRLGPACGAQAVRGKITARSSGEPVAGGIVVLLDAAGKPVSATMAGDSGDFVIGAPAAARYALRVDRVGFRSTTSRAFDLQLGDTLDFPITIGSENVSLRAVQVTADRRCLVRPQEGLAAARLWDEARKALSATRLAQTAHQQGHYVVRVRLSKRELDPQTLRERHNVSWEREGETVNPFVSADPTQLARNGYVVSEVDGSSTYFAPDAAVLLSDVFLDTHCLRVQPAAAAQQSLIGLAFEPLPRAAERGGRDAPAHVDVRGVLWLDRESAELRFMEYEYSELHLDVPTDDIGGRVEFRRLPNGRWIVGRWFIRMPQLSRQRVSVSPLASHPTEWRTELIAIREEGGEVVEVLPPNARRSAVAAVQGTVFDSLRGAPLSQVRVFLSGTSHAAVSDEQGRFKIDSVAPGAYLVSILEPRLDTLMLEPPSRQLTLSAGRTTETELALPSFATVTSALCPGSRADDSTAVLLGVMRDTSGARAGAVDVAASWTTFSTMPGSAGNQLAMHPFSAETKSAPTGRFALCGVPANSLVKLTARSGRTVAERTGLRLLPRELRRVDLSLRAR